MTATHAMPRIVLLSGSAPGLVCDLHDDRITVGRSGDNTIVLPDIDVSRTHAEFTREDNGYRLRDLGSRNGTRVNAGMITETRLAHGDWIQFGTVEARYELVPASASGLAATVPLAVPAPLGPRVAQLEAENRELQARFKELNVVHTKARAELDHLRNGAPRVGELLAERQRLLTELETARQAVPSPAKQPLVVEGKSATSDVAAPEPGEIQRLRGELALARAQLFNAGIVPTVSVRSSANPAAESQSAASTPALPLMLARDREPVVRPAPAIAPTKRPARWRPARVALVLLAVSGLVVVGVTSWMAWDWQRRDAADFWTATARAAAGGHATPLAKAGPASVLDPAEVARDLELSPAAAARLYIDPGHRFVCVSPEGWTVQGAHDAEQSRLQLTLGENRILVTCHGKNWSDLTRADQARVTELVTQRLSGASYEGGLYAQISPTETTWREVEAGLALQYDITVVYPTYQISVRCVEYRHQGRANSIELRVRNPAERVPLLTAFETFLENFHSLGADETVPTLTR